MTRLVRPVLGLAVLLALVVAGRELLVRGTLTRVGSAARRLGEVSRAGLPDPRAPFGPGDALLWLLDPRVEEAPPAVETPPVPEASGATAVQRPFGPTPAPVVVLQTATVLGLAERGAVPRAVMREASGDMPAGLEILDGAGLGIGWFPGDRLILVDGTSVSDRAEVVRQVLERRARREPVITATLARRTRAGVVTYQVLVAQPYRGAEIHPASPE